MKDEISSMKEIFEKKYIDIEVYWKNRISQELVIQILFKKYSLEFIRGGTQL